MATENPLEVDVPIKANEIYFRLIELAQNTENNRWTRLNNILLIDAIFIAAWSTVYVKDSIEGQQIVLIILCIPGVILSFIWSKLGARTNRYHQFYIREAKKIEAKFSSEFNKIVTNADEFSGAQNDIFSRSSFIIQYVPAMLGFLFVVLLGISVCCNNTGVC